MGSLGTWFAVAAGGALGSMARFWLAGAVTALTGPRFPWGTLLINVLGSFVIGFVAALTGPHGRQFVGTTGRQFVMVGICGGYTTFSSFSLQTLNLANHDEWLMAGANVCLSVVVCLVAVSIGYTLATAIGPIRWI